MVQNGIGCCGNQQIAIAAAEEKMISEDEVVYPKVFSYISLVIISSLN